ncbi:unnamed protein product [Ixodes hexagonus]
MAPFLVSWVAAKPGDSRVVVSQTIVVSKGQVTNVSSRVLVGPKAGPSGVRCQQAAVMPNASVLSRVSGVPNISVVTDMSVVPKVSNVPNLSHVTKVNVAPSVSTVSRDGGVPSVTTVLNASIMPTVATTISSAISTPNGTLRSVSSTVRASATPSNVSKGRLHGFLESIVGSLKKSKSTRRPAVEMLQEAFQIDHRGWRAVRLPRSVPTEVTETVENGTLQVPLIANRDTQAEMLLFGALLLLALAALTAYKPTQAPQGIKLRPGNTIASYERLRSFDDCQFVDEPGIPGPWRGSTVRSSEALSDRLRSLAWTKVLASRLARHVRERMSMSRTNKDEVAIPHSPRPQVQAKSSTASLGFESAAESRVEPYTANFLVRDVPAGVRRLLVNVQLRQKSPQGRTHTYQKEMAFDLDTWRLPQ